MANQKARTCVTSCANGWHQYSYRSHLVSSVFSLSFAHAEISCSPFQWMGPSRFTQPPCPITSLPPIDIVVISQLFNYSFTSNNVVLTMTILTSTQSPVLVPISPILSHLATKHGSQATFPNISMLKRWIGGTKVSGTILPTTRNL